VSSRKKVASTPLSDRSGEFEEKGRFDFAQRPFGGCTEKVIERSRNDLMQELCSVVLRPFASTSLSDRSGEFEEKGR